LPIAAGIGAPYLRSVIVRDAALTSWINVTAAAIAAWSTQGRSIPGSASAPTGASSGSTIAGRQHDADQGAGRR